MSIKLEFGKTYLTSSGRKARCLGFNPWPTNAPAAVAIEGRQMIESYSIDGLFRAGKYGSKGSYGLDIVGEYREPIRVWAALRPDGTIFDFYEKQPTELDGDLKMITLCEVSD